MILNQNKRFKIRRLKENIKDKSLFSYNFSKSNFGKIVLLASVSNFCKIDFYKMKT